MRIAFLLVSVSAAAPPLPTLTATIDASSVISVGFDHAADFAHQLHVAYSQTVAGSCLFAAQPFHCATSKFAQDTIEPWTPWTHVPNCDGCTPGTRMPFDHCKSSPHVVDVGSLVDYPRRHCGQNPISISECFDDVDFLKPARVFAFRGSKDGVYKDGAVENTVALLAQMIAEPAATIRLVTDLPFPHVLPINATAFSGQTEAAGYDGPGECLRHVYNSSSHGLIAADTRSSSWLQFDQKALTETGVGFQESGWIYLPEACASRASSSDAAAGEPQCRLVVMPGKCDPGSSPAVTDDSVEQFARYAEGSSLVLLHPCVGGDVDKSKYKYAKEIEDGKLDVYGQLGSGYTQQSAPHMRGVGNMIKRLLGKSIVPPSSPRTLDAGPSTATATTPTSNEERHIIPVKLPTLHIDRSTVVAAGCSNTADFSHQLHVAFSSLVTGSCIFSGQPYRCAVTRFTNDYLVPKARATGAGMQCIGCPENGTLIYDHCKNHPHWVELDTLARVAETAADVDDPKVHLAGARVFSFGPTHDRCYQKGAMENIANFHKRYANDSSQIKLVVDQPFPHTLPTNSTPYFNRSDPAGYDGPGECLKHVLGTVPIAPAIEPGSPLNQDYWEPFNQLEFLSSIKYGMSPAGWLFTPPACKNGTCSLLVLPSGCFAPFGGSPFNQTGGSDDAFARYAIANKIVILKPCAGAPIDVFKWPDNHENLRGMVDVYGQLGNNYATQKGGQTGPIGAMIKRLLGVS